MTDPPLKQWERDWIWFEAWGRYSWNPDIPAEDDRIYWIERLSERYGSKEAAAKILDAYNDSGECAPRILRRFGITEIGVIHGDSGGGLAVYADAAAIRAAPATGNQ